MARTAADKRFYDDSRESCLNQDIESILGQVRESYKEYKNKERIAKAKKKKRYFITSAIILLVLTGSIMIFGFAGLLNS